MATTIKSTSLDFDAIKNNLKEHLAAQSEFADYNFEASGLSNILDVLAYNTHYNGLIANFALNESFLGTAQLRSSIVSLSEGIGYVPDSKSASRAVVNLSMSLSGIEDRPNKIQIPSGYKFTSTVDETEYVFQTLEDIEATDDGFGSYLFLNADQSRNIVVYEGTARQKTFIVGTDADTSIYVIPDQGMDADTAVVRVYDTASGSAFTTYTNILDATIITANSTLFILREAPNGYYELTFGNGTTLGQAPRAGNKIVISYLSVAGADADSANVFEPQSQVTVGGTGYPVSVSTVSKSVGGGEKESIESIRKNAPFQYAAQNRMVTAADYSSLVLRNFSSLIQDIQSYGGEDAIRPKFGTVFMSILFNDDVTDEIIQITKDSIQDLAEQLSVASFTLEFEDPVTTYIESGVFFRFNPRLTTLSRNTIQNDVKQAVATYFANNTGKFRQAFRRSNMLTLVDDVSPAVLSSRAEIKMQQRITPTLTAISDYSLRFPQALADPDDVFFRVESTLFRYNGRTVYLRNKLMSNKLELWDPENKIIVVDNLGSYSGDTVSITGLQVDSIIGADDFIKISVTPANESAIVPVRQDRLVYDTSKSFARVVETTATN